MGMLLSELKTWQNNPVRTEFFARPCELGRDKQVAEKMLQRVCEGGASASPGCMLDKPRTTESELTRVSFQPPNRNSMTNVYILHMCMLLSVRLVWQNCPGRICMFTSLQAVRGHER